MLPVGDTLARAGEQSTSSSTAPDAAVQTPQAFTLEDLIYAYEEAGRSSPTDETTVMLALA